MRVEIKDRDPGLHGLDLQGIDDPIERDEIFKFAWQNSGFACKEEVSIAQVAIKVDKPVLHSKKKKWEAPDARFKIVGGMRLD